jgi:6-pyruvoyltetrahydropterin/6-carboxytetrahydropterin synthase
MATYTISKRFRFEAAHSLPDMPEGHKCKRLHGHSYVVEVVLAADTLDELGMVKDYAGLDTFKHWLEVTLDHRKLDDYMQAEEAGQSTAENLARLLWRRVDDFTVHPLLPPTPPSLRCVAVRVCETENTWAEYTP